MHSKHTAGFAFGISERKTFNFSVQLTRVICFLISVFLFACSAGDKTTGDEEGGHTYDTKPDRSPGARISQLLSDGTTKVLYDKVLPLNVVKSKESSADMEEGLIPPLTGVTYHEGKLYISHRSRYSTYDLGSGEFKTIINGLPSWGEFLNAKLIFKDGKMYFFLSTQGNSGVIEKHWIGVIDEFNKPDAHEVPGEDVTLTGQNFWVPSDKVKIVDADSVETGAYVKLDEKTKLARW